MFVCSFCDSPDVCYDAWVHVNTDEIYNGFSTYYCPDCEGQTSIKEA